MQAASSAVAQAVTLYDEARSAFCDERSGAWFDTRAAQGDLFVRARSTHDGAVPSGYSMMLHAMISLWHATGEERFARDASLAIAHQSGAIAASPVGAINAMRALLRIYRTCPLATGMLRELLPLRQAAVQSAVGRAPDDAVQVFSHVDRVTVSTDVPAIFRVRVAIQPGYHVMSATASDGLVPFRIDVMNGKGVAAHVDYPEPRAAARQHIEHGRCVSAGEYAHWQNHASAHERNQKHQPRQRGNLSPQPARRGDALERSPSDGQDNAPPPGEEDQREKIADAARLGEQQRRRRKK
jgi:hypothetical protein